jgi:DNA-binding IclR family transcriptional regulator
VVAALNVSVHATRGSMTTLRRDFLPLAREAAEAIEGDLRRAAGTAPRTSA